MMPIRRADGASERWYVTRLAYQASADLRRGKWDRSIGLQGDGRE